MKRKFIKMSFPFWKDCRRLLIVINLMSLVFYFSAIHASATPNFDLSAHSSTKESLNSNTLNHLSVSIKGKVFSVDGEPLPGATIQIKGTTNGTISDLDGNFVLDVPTGEETLVVSYVGYETAEVQIAGKTELTITLALTSSKLDEVVVVGYGTQKKSVVTGAIAKVSAEELSRSKDLRIEQSLQGKTAGVMIMNNSGQPGDNMTIQIRGTGTNNNPDPLFLVDGLPLEKSDLNFLNNSDVESVEVLKDASSAAIYGTRGANGVVMITTKQGKKGQKFIVTYDGSYGIQNSWRKLDLLHAKDYMNIINEAGENDGRNPYSYFSQQMVDTLQWDTDWQDAVYNKNAPKTSHTFSATGGGEKSTYSTSLSLYSQDGIIAKDNSGFKRITYRLNTTHEFGRLTIGSNLNYANIEQKGISSNNQFGNGINQALNMPPVVPIVNDTGKYGVPTDFKTIGMQEITNPIALWNYINKRDVTNMALGNLSADFKIIEGLVLRSAYGLEISYRTIDEYFPKYFIDQGHKNDIAYMSKEIRKALKWNFDNTLTYSKTFGNHDVTAMIGATWFKETEENMYASKGGLIFDDFEHAYFDNSTVDTLDAVHGGYTPHTLKSYFGRLNYSYKEKYLLTASLRKDGSSRFGSLNKWANFPAFSLGWVVSKENFFPENKLIQFLKIRGSWGKNGSDKLDDFQYVALMKNGINYYFGDAHTQYSGILPEFIPNPALKWEASEMLDIGTDMYLFSNRLTLAFDFYNKITSDWLIQAPSLQILGAEGTTWVNGGSVRNRGYELELNYKNNLTKNLLINIGLTGATNKSKVLDIPNAEHVLQGGSGIHGQSNVLRAEVGSIFGYFNGYKTDGIIQNDEEAAQYATLQPGCVKGDFIFVDVNGDGRITELDRTNIGSPYPKFTGGISINLSWKIVDFSMFWYTALGQQIFNAYRRSDLKYGNFTTDVLDRWHGEGTSNDYPRVTISDPNGNWKKVSDFFVEDADFFRLKTLSIGISLPKKWTNAIKLGKVRFYFLGENLITFTKYDGLEVEVGGTPFGLDGTNPIGIDYGVYPVSKTYTGGLSIEF